MAIKASPVGRPKMFWDDGEEHSMHRMIGILLALCGLATLPALAQPHRDAGRPQGNVRAHGSVPGSAYRNFGVRPSIPQPYHWRGTRLNESRWRSGSWYHGVHNGRSGWWWTVGPDWFLFSSPIYPVPTLYGPPGGDPGWWYWCDSYQDYYPYVTYCPSGWRRMMPR